MRNKIMQKPQGKRFMKRKSNSNQDDMIFIKFQINLYTFNDMIFDISF